MMKYRSEGAAMPDPEMITIPRRSLERLSDMAEVLAGDLSGIAAPLRGLLDRTCRAVDKGDPRAGQLEQKLRHAVLPLAQAAEQAEIIGEIIEFDLLCVQAEA